MKQPRGGAGTDLLFFIFFIIVLGVVWSLTGGPSRTISHSGPFLNPPFPLGDGTGYSIGFDIPSVDIPSTGGSSYNAGNNGGSANDSRSFLDRLLTSVRGGFGEVKEETSPYAGKVTLSIGGARATDASKEYVIIKTTRDLDSNLTISNWRIESTASYIGTTLGGAAYLPYSGQVNTEPVVSVGKDTTIYVTTGRSPIGASFRTNTCTGYFEQFQDFEPRLKEECPKPEDVLASKVSSGFVPNNVCADFVGRVRRCIYTLTEIPDNLDNECRVFVTEDLNYNACVTQERNKSDFYKNEWRLYLDRDQELWKNSHERIRLLDENGLVISSVSY